MLWWIAAALAAPLTLTEVLDAVDEREVEEGGAVGGVREHRELLGQGGQRRLDGDERVTRAGGGAVDGFRQRTLATASGSEQEQRRTAGDHL